MTTSRDQALRRTEAEIRVLIRRVKRVVGHRARSVHPDLHPIGYLLLSHLVEAGPLRAADLVEALGMDKGGVSRQVQAMVDLGLVERRPDPADRRATLLAATDEARRRTAEVAAARRERFDQRLSDWTETEIQEFAERLAAYNAALADD